MSRGRPRKDTDVSIKQQLNAWSRICSNISKSSNLSSSRLEVYLKCGNGTGRSWNYWKKGERLPDVSIRQAVILNTTAEGWISGFSDQEIDHFIQIGIASYLYFNRGELMREHLELFDIIFNLLNRGIFSPDDLITKVHTAAKDLGLRRFETLNGKENLRVLRDAESKLAHY